jgi:predicted enzyme related to lactoylglutathione lyase
VPRSVDFYRAALGLEAVTTMGEPANFAILVGGSASLAIAAAESPAVAGIAACYIDVANVDAVFERCGATGAEITNPLTTHSWQMRDFVFRDPDGHQIAVGQRVAGVDGDAASA